MQCIDKWLILIRVEPSGTVLDLSLLSQVQFAVLACLHVSSSQSATQLVLAQIACTSQRYSWQFVHRWVLQKWASKWVWFVVSLTVFQFMPNCLPYHTYHFSHLVVTRDRDFLVTRVTCIEHCLNCSHKDSLFIMATISTLTIIFLKGMWNYGKKITKQTGLL